MTAAVDGPDNGFATHQTSQYGLNPNTIPFSPTFNPNFVPPTNANQLSSQAFQMQMLQLEILRIQVTTVQLPFTRSLYSPRNRIFKSSSTGFDSGSSPTPVPPFPGRTRMAGA